MKEKKKKENIFSKRSFFVTLVVIVGIMIIALVMNLILPEKTTNIDDETWKQAINESQKISDKDDGLTSVYAPESQAVSSTALPAEKQNKSDLEAEKESTSNNQQPLSEQTENSNTASIAFVSPVKGEVLKDYSSDELQYSETMNDWRIHSGIDIAADEGADISAAADGTVEKVTKDGMLGTSITILHPDGTKTIYGNMQEDSAISEGSAVKAGEIIGKVGKTAALEILEPPHLHFEVISQNKNADPHDFLPEKTSDTENNVNE